MEDDRGTTRKWLRVDAPLLGVTLVTGLFIELVLLLFFLLIIGGHTLYQVFAYSAHFPPLYLWFSYLLSLLFASIATASTYWLMKTCWSAAKMKHPNLVSCPKTPPD